MAKSKEQLKARSLRKKGFSIKEISEKLHVSKSSASAWCSGVILTKKQTQRLYVKMVKGGHRGRMIGASTQKERKKKKIEKYLQNAKKEICSLKKKELLVAGIALYWGEGSKVYSGVRFHNSDPAAIKFAMRWFREILKIRDERFLMYISINEIHKNRLHDVKKYWSETTGVSTAQFRNPILIRSKSKKVYENLLDHYGTLSIRIAKSTDLLYQILGWIKALDMAA